MNNTKIGNIISKIVDKTWNVIKNGIQSLLSLFQEREPPPYEPRELPPYEPIVPAPFVLGESEESESDGWYVSDKSESYLRMFDRQYTIHYRDWYHSDPSIFMDEVRELIILSLIHI